MRLLSFALIWYAAFMAILIYWGIAEAARPGVQYADPLLPCAVLATAVAVVGSGIVALCGRRRSRR